MCSHHGVLAHQDDTLATEGASDLVHLLGADIVDADDEDGLVFFEEALELVEVAGLVAGSGTASHVYLQSQSQSVSRIFGCILSRRVWPVHGAFRQLCHSREIEHVPSLLKVGFLKDS